MKFRWQYKETNKNLVNQILENREKTVADYQERLSDLPDEALLKDIDLAVYRISEAMAKNERIVIFGHDDPDGITATYLLYDFFDSCGYQNHYSYIPNRLVDHHGIQDNLIEYLKKRSAKLLITVDNGISSYEKIEEITKLKIDVIVTDHHHFDQDKIPIATAVINPKREDCDYPYDMIAGVGVSLMLVRRLAKYLKKEVKSAYYFWTAVGSLADRVPMNGVNWILVRHVLDHWDEIKGNTIDMLKSVCNPIITLHDKMNFLIYSYRMIANGRASNGQHHGLKFLLSNDSDKYNEFAIIQTEKKNTEQNIFGLNSVIADILADYDGSGIVFFDDENIIPSHLLGTCATFLVNNLYEPVLILQERDEIIICEGRCSDGFSILDAYKFCEDTLIQYGGHIKAGGFTMNKKNLPLFIAKYKEYFHQQKKNIDINKSIKIDAVIPFSDFDNHINKELEFMLPFGQENKEPIILVKGYNFTGSPRLAFDNGIKNQIFESKLDNIVVQLGNNGQVRVIDFQDSNVSEN